MNVIQKEDLDVPALNARDRIRPAHGEKQSGRDFERPLYQKLLRKMKPHDIPVLKSIDRLGRNYEEILEQWRRITKEKKVDIVVLDMPLLGTRSGRNRTGTLIADIVLQLLSYVAQTERECIRQRQKEGIEAAKRQRNEQDACVVTMTCNLSFSATEKARKTKRFRAFFMLILAL